MQSVRYRQLLMLRLQVSFNMRDTQVRELIDTTQLSGIIDECRKSQRERKTVEATERDKDTKIRRDKNTKRQRYKEIERQFKETMRQIDNDTKR